MKYLQQIPKAVVLVLTVLLALVLVSCANQNKNSQSETTNLTAQQKADERKHILKTADDTLVELYKHEPAAQKVIEKAYGYAVFANTGYNIILYVGGKGRGVASASANATVKVGDVDVDEAVVTTLVPGVSLYQINDEGIDIQADWG